MNVKPEPDQERESFIPQNEHVPTLETSRRMWWLIRYVRPLVEILMAITIVLLYFRPVGNYRFGKPSPIPVFPKKAYTFIEQPDLVNEGMFYNETANLLTLHKWIPMSSSARGYIQIPDTTKYALGDPYEVWVSRTSNGPAYMMSVFHQLHCLSYLVQHYERGYSGTELTQEVAHHSAHCFDYLRQSLMCSADTSLEGKTEAGPGWGSKHECTDYDALLEWANDHAAYKWRGNMPEEATL